MESHCTDSDDDRFIKSLRNSVKSILKRLTMPRHVRLAYAYLCDNTPEVACDRMKASLLRFLAHVGASPDKFHETITRAWILAVRHFMDQAGPTGSYSEFIDRAPDLLAPSIMLTHYSAETLFSDAARSSFIRPDQNSRFRRAERCNWQTGQDVIQKFFRTFSSIPGTAMTRSGFAFLEKK